MNKEIKEKLKKIIKFSEENADWVDQVIVFGEALTGDESSTIRLAVEFIDNSDYENRAYNENIYNLYGKFVGKVNDVTGGNFEVLIMNGDNLTDNTMHEVEEGRIIYGTRRDETTTE